MVYLVQIVQLPLTRQYLFSLALPIAVLASTLCLYRSGWSLVLTVPSVCVNMSLYMFLVPGFASWFLFKRAFDLRVWLWLSAISFIWGWVVLPVSAMVIAIFSFHKWLRMAGLLILIPLALLGLSCFIMSLYWSTSKIVDGRGWRSEELWVSTGDCFYNVYFHHVNSGLLSPETDEIRVERKIAPFLALRKIVYSKEFGWIDNLKTLDVHTIQFDVFTDARYSSEDAGPITEQVRID